MLDANPYNFDSYELSELEILSENTEFPQDYWDKLHHQAAISAMQGILANCNHQLWEREANSKTIAKQSYEIATALVEKLKNEK